MAEVTPFARMQCRIYERPVNGAPAVFAEKLVNWKTGGLVPRRYVYEPMLNGASFRLVDTFNQSGDGSWNQALPSQTPDPLNAMAQGGWFFPCAMKVQAGQAAEQRKAR